MMNELKSTGSINIQTCLDQLGVETYTPELVMVRGGRGRFEPLFPAYVFVKADPLSGQWSLIHWARGFSYLLEDQEQPPSCPEELLHSIKTPVEQWNAGGWEATLRARDRVTIQAGPFEELDALIQEHMAGRQRCCVLVSLMGRGVSVTLRWRRSAASRCRGASPNSPDRVAADGL